MVLPTDINRNQDTGLSPDSSLPAVTPSTSPSGSQSAMRFEVCSDERSVAPPSLPLSASQFFSNTDLLMQVALPVYWPEEHPNNPIPGCRVIFQQWESLILENHDYYLCNNSPLCRSHMYLTQSREDLDRPIEFIGVNLGETSVPWYTAHTVRDRLDVIIYTLHGLIAVLDISHPTNTPHARIVQEFERIRRTQHLLPQDQLDFLALKSGQFVFWAAQLMASDPVYAAYAEHVRQQPLSPLSRQPELPTISVVEQVNDPARRSSEPELGASTAPASRERSASVPSIGETSVLLQSATSNATNPATRAQKGKGRAVESIPEEEPLPHPAQSPGPIPSQPTIPAPVPSANPPPPVKSSVRPTSTSVPSSTTPSSQQAQSNVDPGTLDIDQLIQLADEYSRDQDSRSRRGNRHMKSVPIINGCGEQFQWEMDLAWYNYHKAYVDQFAAIARDVLLNRQMYQSSQRFGNTILTLEKQRRPKAKISSETHDGLMLAASRYGTRPPSQYTERRVQTGRSRSRVPSQHVGVQTTLAPRISRGAQTHYLAIAPPLPTSVTNGWSGPAPAWLQRSGSKPLVTLLPTPPEPLDVIDEEEGEYEDEEDGHSDTQTHFEGDEELFKDASEEIRDQEDDFQSSHNARRQRFTDLNQQLRNRRQKISQVIDILSDMSSEFSPPRVGTSRSQPPLATSTSSSSQSTQSTVDSDDEFLPDDPEAFNDAKTNIIKYWTIYAPDHDAAERMQVALKRLEIDTKREQRKQQKKERKGKDKQVPPEAQQSLDEWREMKKELLEARDLKRRYETQHGRKGCGPCSNSHAPSGCKGSEQVQVNMMHDSGPGKSGFPQTPGGKRVFWSSDTKESDTPLPKYTTNASPAPNYTFHSATAGPIDPSAFADTEVFVQNAHEFDTPGSGSSQHRDVPPHMDPEIQQIGVRFSTPHGMRGGRGTARGRGGWFYSSSNLGRSPYVPRQATPYPRNVPPPTPSWRGTPGGPPDDPGNDPSGQGADEEDPFKADESDKGKDRAADEQSEDLESRAEREAKEARKDRVATQSKIRMKDPETFDSKKREDLDTFIEQCENIYEAKPDIYADDTAKIQHASSYCSGKVEAAINVLQHRKRLGFRVAPLETWAGFIAELRADFGLRNPLAFAQARVMKIKQENGESYGDFYTRFAVMATCSGFDETSLCWYLLRALSKATLERLRGSNIIPSDYQALHRHLRNLDINDHSMMEAGLIDGYDVQVGIMPSTTKTTTTTTTNASNTSSTPNTSCTTVTRTQNNPTGGRTTVTNTTTNRPNFILQSNYQNRTNTGGGNFRNPRTTTMTTEVRKAVTGLPGPSNAPVASSSNVPPPANPISWPDKPLREQRRRDGLCILCGSPDHFIPRCPHNHQIARGARSFAELPDPDTVWVETAEGQGHLVHLDDFLEESDDEGSENIEETQEETSET
ncbi:hypothetical protein PQX77_019743 [Marasmius sp. AFHP31]|nr:hypothetical protein PQX77_019743 [Marasmius sp. AFHP31]